MAAPDVDTTAPTYASAVAISQRRGAGAPRGHRHRRLVALTLANRLALAAWFVVAIAFEPVRLPLLAIAVPASLCLDFWLRKRLQDTEETDGAGDVDDVHVAAADEQALHAHLEGARSERRATVRAGAEVLAGTAVAHRHALPTRELLRAHSASEAVELVGVAVVALTAPAPVGMAVGVVLWLLGGRAGMTTAKLRLGQRLYRTPVDDRTRERWLDREHRLTMAAYVVVLLVALARLLI